MPNISIDTLPRRRQSARMAAWLLATLFCLLSRASTAQLSNWSFALASTSMSGAPDSVLTFEGIITNQTGGEIILDAVSLDFDPAPYPPAYEIDFADEFIDTGLVIPPGGYSGPLFRLHWFPSAPIGAIGIGAVTLFVESPADPDNLSADYSAAVIAAGPPVAVPEPGLTSLLSVVAGGALLLIARGRPRPWRSTPRMEV